MLTCMLIVNDMLMSSLHQIDIILCMLLFIMHCSTCIVNSGSGQLVFGSGQPIRVKKTRGARLRAWADALPESDGECGHVRRPILTPFSLVASSRPPLHSGMVKTQF